MIVLPDTEKVVLALLRHYLPIDVHGMKFGVLPPMEWADNLPYCVSARVGGKSPNPRIDQALISVQVFAAKRDQSSDLARKVQGALYQAYLDQYVTSEGHISWFQVTKSPVPERDGLSGKHDDSFMFDATYTLWVRA